MTLRSTSPSDPSGFKLIGSFLIRALTGGLIAVVMLGVVMYASPVGLGLLVALIATMSARELFRITFGRRPRLPQVLAMVACAAMPVSAAYYGYLGLNSIVVALLIALLTIYCFIKELRMDDVARTFIGALYVGFMLSHLVLLHRFEAGEIFVLAVIVSVWANDVFAYLIGSALGRTKMAPRISPNKTWEGFAGGALFTVVVWSSLTLVPQNTIQLPILILIGLVVAVAGAVGDLLESRIKREGGVKDSGTFFPGHGGVLDRFDSLIVVSVVSYYLFLILGV